MGEEALRTVAISWHISALIEDLARRDDVPPDAVVRVAVERYWRQRRQDDAGARPALGQDAALLEAAGGPLEARGDAVERAQAAWDEALSDHMDNA